MTKEKEGNFSPATYAAWAGYWGLSWMSSNGVTMTIDSLGDIRLTRGLAGESISVPLEDLRLLLASFDERHQR